MIELKFKAKSIDSNEWIYGNNIIADPVKCSINGVQVDYNTVCQYIGKCGCCNNIEVYTNDIVLIDNVQYTIQFADTRDMKAFLAFDKEQFTDDNWSRNVEKVIGNTFD